MNRLLSIVLICLPLSAYALRTPEFSLTVDLSFSPHGATRLSPATWDHVLSQYSENTQGMVAMQGRPTFWSSLQIVSAEPSPHFDEEDQVFENDDNTHITIKSTLMYESDNVALWGSDPYAPVWNFEAGPHTVHRAWGCRYN